MKSRGFTLIELLAVIIILAVIALIATPIIMGVIEDSKKGAAKNSGYGYVEAVEIGIGRAMSNKIKVEPGVYTIQKGSIIKSGKTVVVDYRGSEVTGTVTLGTGEVLSGDFIISGYKLVYNGKTVTTK